MSRSKSRSRSHSRSPKNNYGGADKPAPDPSKILGVFGLSAGTMESDLRHEFERFGDLDKVELIMDKRTHRSRCFGFIYFANIEDAMKAKDGMNGTNLHGRTIRTDFSMTRKAHSPTPGRYMGRPSDPRDYRRSSSSRSSSSHYSSSSRRDYRYDPYDDRDRDRYYRGSRDRYSERDHYDDRDRYDRDKYR